MTTLEQLPSCPHPDFDATVTVNRMEDSGAFVADVTIACSVCHEPFRFLGLPSGLSFERPMVSIDGLELRAPIEPEGRKRLALHSSFEVTQ